MKQIRKRLTYANVMSSLAVFLILGGATAFAAVKKVGPNEIKANSIKTGKIVKEAVTAGKIKKAAVNESRLADAAVTTNKLADNAVTTPKIADLAVTTGKIANDAVTGEKVNEATLGEVPNAANATNAASANTVKQITSFAYEADNGNSNTIVLNDFFGLTLRASCESGANKGLTVTAASSVPGATISYTSSWQAEDTKNNAFGNFSATPVTIYSPTATTKTTNGGVGIGFSAGQIVYSQPKGAGRVSVNWGYTANVAGNDCYWAGTVVGAS